MDIKSNGSAYRRIKGFTLVELITVIAIISVLAGVMNLATQGLVRNARLETLNDRAQMVYMAFQDMVLDCEIKQEYTFFEPRGKLSGSAGETTSDITGAVVFFRISEKDHSGYSNVNGSVGLGDEIHVMTTHKNSVTHKFIAGVDNICSISVWAPGTTNPLATSSTYGGANHTPDHGATYWEKFNKYISGRMDASAAGTYVVSVDLENYQVLSVICRNVTYDGRDPKTGLYDGGEVDDPSKALGNYIIPYENGGNVLTVGSLTVKPPQRTYILKDKQHQRDISKKVGVDIGAYPYGDDLYDNVTKPTTL